MFRVGALPTNLPVKAIAQNVESYFIYRSDSVASYVFVSYRNQALKSDCLKKIWTILSITLYMLTQFNVYNLFIFKSLFIIL